MFARLGSLVRFGLVQGNDLMGGDDVAFSNFCGLVSRCVLLLLFTFLFATHPCLHVLLLSSGYSVFFLPILSGLFWAL